MSHKTVKTVSGLFLVFLISQDVLFTKLSPKVDASLTEKPPTKPEQRKYFSRFGFSDSRTNSVNITRTNGNIVPVDITKESNLMITPIPTVTPVPTLRIFQKSNFPGENEDQENKIKLNEFLKRNKRSVDYPKERKVSSHISLQTTDNTIRVDFSGDAPEEPEYIRPIECRFITNDNRRLIESLVDAVNCGSFPHVNNGHFELFLGDLDDDIEPRLKCDRYYVRHGPINGGLICENGKWHLDASCENIRCEEEFEVPINGKNISMTGNNFNDTATFSCLYGYELIGDKILTCGEDGKWLGDIPTCELVQCPNVTAPDHGFVSDDLEIDFNQTSLTQLYFNTTITYRCQEGYTLVGKSEFTCQADGTWGHRRKPHCKKVCLVPFSNRLASTVWLQPYMNPLHIRTEFQFGQYIIYLCKKRYKSVNDGGAMCINGEWVPKIECHRIYSCTEPQPPKHGRIAHQINRHFIQYVCDSGYQISGSDSQTCLSNGTWSGTKPQCRKMCRMPQVFAMKNAWLSFEFKKFQQGNQLLVGSNIEYSCKDGYQKALNVSSTCNDGNWIPRPRCLSKIVRLTGSKLENEGLVEVYINGEWGLVCDHMFVHFGRWDNNESNVLCKMLGYTYGNREAAANYQRITRHITYQSVSCSGDEQNIFECNTMRAKVWCNRFIGVKCSRRRLEF